MSNATLTFSMTADVEPPMNAESFFNIFEQLWTIGSGLWIRRTIAISNVADTLIDLGGVTSLGYMAYYNADPANYMKILTSLAGVAFCRPGPGRGGIFELEPGLVLYARADTAPVNMEYAIWTR